MRKLPSLKKIYIKLGYLGNHYLHPIICRLHSRLCSPARLPYIRRMRLLAPVILLSISACASREVTYIGDLRPLAGVCDPPARAELTRKGKAILFLPNSGTIVLSGLQDGAIITATKTMVGADKKPYKQVFNGHLQDQAIQGTYETARCRYTVLLHPIGG